MLNALMQTPWRQAGPWLGIATAPASLMLGGSVAQQMPFHWVPWALVLGAGVVWMLSSLQGYIGVVQRRPLVELARPVLGSSIARWSNSLLLAMLMIGWAGFGVGVAGRSLAQLTSLPEGIALFAWSGAVTFGLWRGIHRGSLIALLGSLATLVLIGWGFVQASSLSAPPSGVIPQGTFFGGVSLVVGYGAAFCLRCADFTMTVSRPSHVRTVALLGLSLPLLGVSLAGAWLYQATGTWDLSVLLSRLGFPSMAHAFVVIGFLGAGLTNMHSGSLALQDLLRCPRRLALILIAASSVGLAWLGFEQAMVLWLKTLSVVVVPLIGVILTHYGAHVQRESTVNVAGLMAWGLGAAAGLLAPADWPSAVVGILVAALTYLVLTKARFKRFNRQEGAISHEP